MNTKLRTRILGFYIAQIILFVYTVISLRFGLLVLQHQLGPLLSWGIAGAIVLVGGLSILQAQINSLRNKIV